MEYSRREVNQDRERDIVIGLIVSDQFTKEILPLLKPEYFALPYSRTVSNWCVDFYNNYSKAPDKEIMSVFESKKAEIRDQSVIETIEIFLTKLSDRFEAQESFNVGYNVDRALNYFKERSIDLMIERIKVAKLSGDLNRAEAEVSNFKRVEKGLGSSISVWTDETAAIEAIREGDNKDILVSFPGALGQVIRPLTSEDFFCAAAAPKKGKSWFLIEIAILGSLNKKNTLFITLEMTAKQLMTRMYQRITGTLSDQYGSSEGSEINFPYFDVNFEITRKVLIRKEWRECLTVRSAIKKMRSINGFVKSDTLKIIEAPSGSLTAEQLEAHLDNLEHYENWTPQIIVIDYIDIMCPSKKSDHRNEINSRWLDIRGLGQKRKVLIATVSHTGRQTLTRDAQVTDLSEDIRKVNHCSIVVAINQNEEDKANYLQRFSVIADRFRGFTPNKEAAVLQSFDIGASYLDSKIIYKHKTEKND